MEKIKFSLKSLFILLFFFPAWADVTVHQIFDVKNFTDAIAQWEDEIKKIPDDKKTIKINTLEIVINYMKTLIKESNMSFWQATDNNYNLPEGLMVIRLTENEKEFSEVEAIGSAPWNLVGYEDEGAPHPRIERQVGEALMDKAIKYIKAKNGLGVQVYPNPNAINFYDRYFEAKQNDGYGTFSKEGRGMFFTFPVIKVAEVEYKKFNKALFQWYDELEKIPDDKIDNKINALKTVMDVMSRHVESKSQGLKQDASLWKATKLNSNLSQGLMVIAPTNLKVGFLEVDALASAPWNLSTYTGSPSKTKWVGTSLMEKALRYTEKNKKNGLLVYPNPSAKEFYREYFQEKQDQGFGEFEETQRYMTFTIAR